MNVRTLTFEDILDIIEYWLRVDDKLYIKYDVKISPNKINNKLNSARGANINNSNNLLTSNSQNIISYEHNNDPIENSRHTAVIAKRNNHGIDNFMGVNRMNTEISD